MSSAPVPKWWKEAVVYQIYPASFKDSSGDGVGDIPGIISKLDYVKSLGVDVIWVSPFFKSPQHDLGYDISDYRDVHAPYGTLEDVDALIAGCHDRGLKILFDLVVNHTSDEHPWFKESRSSKDNPKRNWYMWKPPKFDETGKRSPPNNWKGMFGNSTWEFDERTQEYYLHLFATQQPDLNWENPETRKAIYEEAILFWLDKGIDGFRIDTVNMYSKNLDFPDAPITEPGDEWQPAFQYYFNGPRIHEFLQEQYKETFSKYDCVTIGELPFTPDLITVLEYVSAARRELDICIQFDLSTLDHHNGRFRHSIVEWKLPELKDITARTQQLAEPKSDTWAVTFIENHDQARAVSRYASDTPEHRVASGKLLAMYLLTLSGTLIVYEGQELGMINMPKDWDIDAEYHDVSSINEWRDIKEAAKKDPSLLEPGKRGLQLSARDHARTPMQWNASPHAGFTTGSSTWMRVMDSYTTINVANEEDDPDSVLSFYRSFLEFRKVHKQLLVYGKFKLLDRDNEGTMSFLKTSGDNFAFVVLNFTSDQQEINWPSGLPKPVLAASTLPSSDDEHILRPFEGRLYLSTDS